MPANFPRRGEIYFADLDPVVGSEQGGHRPVLVIQNDNGNRYSSILIVAAITSAPTRRTYPVDIVITSEHSGLMAGSRVMLNQIKSVDKQRIGRYVGSLDESEMDRVERAILISLGFVAL